MKIAVLSGKGGTGKTFVSVNLAAAAQQMTYIDCDVEEPNGRLFFRPEVCRTEDVSVMLPRFDKEACIGCRKCVQFCHFNALAFIKGAPRVFPGVCHACGGCALVCPAGAVQEDARPVGVVETGMHRHVRVVTGAMNPGEESGVPVIRAALRQGLNGAGSAVIDCPPGSACTVMESVSAADFCVLVAEPTAFGFHNFKMVYELVSLIGKPCGVVINKAGEPYPPLETFCREQNLPVLLRIPYEKELARLISNAEIAVEQDETYAALFGGLLQKIGEVPA